MELVESYNLISPSDLIEVEGKIGYQRPEEYKSFLLKHNSGQPFLDAVCIINAFKNTGKIGISQTCAVSINVMFINPNTR